jgi:hypothetical protein
MPDNMAARSQGLRLCAGADGLSTLAGLAKSADATICSKAHGKAPCPAETEPCRRAQGQARAMSASDES